MTVRMHRSTDAGAQVLTGQQGKMNAVLLEVLCKGVPAVTPTSISQVAGLATCSMTAHKFATGQTVSVYGAIQPEYNGNQVITVTTANAFTFAVSAGATTPATGTITVGGQKTIGTPTSITRVGTTVTVAGLTTHGLVATNRAYISGCAQPEYNGWQTITTQADANTFTYELLTTQTPTTPATGTIVVRYGDAGLGWSMAFSAANRTIFRQGVSGTRNQYVVAVDETDASSGTFGVGLHMAENATGISTFTNPLFSTEAVTNTGMVKSGTASAVARNWVVVGDHRTFIVLTKPVVTSSGNTDGWTHSYLGDCISFLPGDNYPGLANVATRHSSYPFSSTLNAINTYGAIGGGGGMYFDYVYTTATSATNHANHMSRNHLGAVGDIHVAFTAAGRALNTSVSANASNYRFGMRNVSYSYDTYPDPVHGGINLEKLYVVHGASADNTGNPVVRGELRGLWNPGHRRTQVSVWGNNDTFVGSGELSGKTFEMFDLTGAESWFIIETSDTWGV